LRQFLGQFPDPFVVYDHESDRRLFGMALQGLDAGANIGRASTYYGEALLLREDIAPLIEQ